MANNATLMHSLIAGIVDAAGAALASGNARFYSPGTTTPITVYSDAAASASITQPLVLDAAGRGEVYTLIPCRVIVKDAADSATIYDSDYASNVRAAQVLITNANVNGGAEQDFDAFLTANGGALGNYTESATATAQAAATWLKQTHVLATDYGAAGDGATDDATAIGNAITRVGAADRTSSTQAKTSILTIPQGTWNIASVLTQAVASGTDAIIIQGQGPKVTILEQQSTSAGGLHINYTSQTDVRITIRDLAIHAATTSSGAALTLTNCDNAEIRNIETKGFRTGIDLSASDDSRVHNCEVISTDGNAAAVGIDLGDRCVARDCIVAGTSDLGDGIQISGTDARVYNCVVSGSALQIDSNGARARIADNHVTCAASTSGVDVAGANTRSKDNYIVGSSSTTGLTLGAAGCQSRGDHVDGFTTGISVGAVAAARVYDADYGANTTDLDVNASATLFQQLNNSDGSSIFPARAAATLTEQVSLPATHTPVLSGSQITVSMVQCDSNTDVLTIGNTATTNLLGGELLYIVIWESGGTLTSIAWGSQYEKNDISTDPPTAAPVASVGVKCHLFVWEASRANWQLIDFSDVPAA